MFASGVDDYLTKPFNPEELIARIAAVLFGVRRYPGIEIGLEHRTVTEGTVVRLSATEWALLALLGANAGTVMRNSELLWPVGGPERGEDAGCMCTWMSRVRSKLELHGTHALITSYPGLGYRLASPPELAQRYER